MDEDDEVDALGFYKNRHCKYCKDRLYKGVTMTVCLNGCYLPHGAWVQMRELSVLDSLARGIKAVADAPRA